MMHSFEYSKVSQSLEHCNKLPIVHNIHFFCHQRELYHSDPNLQDFFTIPKAAHCKNPCCWDNCHNFSEDSHIGLDAQRLSTQPTFALWH